MTRDPRRAPQPGDCLRCDGSLVRVDRVALGTVLVSVFAGESAQPCAVTAVSILEWVEAAVGAAVVVLPEGDPRLEATILEAR